MAKKWVCFYSQTGSEINNIRKLLKKDPDIIVYNGDDLSHTNMELLEDLGDKMVRLPAKPSLDDYLQLAEILPKDCLITLNGYLRIIPKYMCEHFNILNLHPGLITKYPELKGFNPQEKAFNLNLPTTGVVIHEVTPELDSGKIIASKEVPIAGNTLDVVYEKLHDAATQLWVDVLKDILK